MTDPNPANDRRLQDRAAWLIYREAQKQQTCRGGEAGPGPLTNEDLVQIAARSARTLSAEIANAEQVPDCIARGLSQRKGGIISAVLSQAPKVDPNWSPRSRGSKTSSRARRAWSRKASESRQTVPARPTRWSGAS